MESAPWGYRSFERIWMVNQFRESAERISIHEWTLETHDLATLPAQVDQLTGALNYLQIFNFEAVSAISEIRQVIQALSRELELHARGVKVDGSALTAQVEALGQLLNEVDKEVQDERSRVGKHGVYIRVTYIYAYCIARIQYSTCLLGWPPTGARCACRRRK